MSSVDLKGMASELAAAQRFLADWWADNHFAEAERFPFELALEELFVNVASYGEDTDGSPCDVRLTLTSKRGDSVIVSLQIQDNGQAFNPVASDEPDLSLSLDERKVGGLGIHLTRSVMDNIHYEHRDSLNQTTVSKTIRV